MTDKTGRPSRSAMKREFAALWSALKGQPLKVFFIGLAGLTIMNLDHSLFAYVLTEIAQEFNWSDVERGWYIAVTFIVTGIAITQFGVLADRMGRKAVLFWSTLVGPFFVAALIWVPNTASLLFFRAVGFAIGGVQSPIAGTLVLEESAPRYRGLTSGFLQVGYPIGWFVASLLVPLVSETFGWRYIFALALLGLPYAWVIARYLREPPAWRAAKAKRDQDNSQVSTISLFQRTHVYKTVFLFLGQHLQVFAYGATLLLTAYFREARGWNLTEAVRLVGLSYLIGAFGYILAAVVGEYVMSRRNTIVVWCWLGCVAFAGMIWWAEGWWQIAVCFSLMTFFFYGSTAVIFTFIAENFPAELRGTATSFSGSLAVNLGVAFGPLALSYMIGGAGWDWGFTICGMVPMFLAGVAFLFLKPVPRHALK